MFAAFRLSPIFNIGGEGRGDKAVSPVRDRYGSHLCVQPVAHARAIV
jgi:hypothetical protein